MANERKTIIINVLIKIFKHEQQIKSKSNILPSIHEQKNKKAKKYR